MKHGKNYRTARGEIDRERLYSPAEAVRMLKGFPAAKFDETVEAHFNLGLNVRHAEQQLRGTLMLPHGTADLAKRIEEEGFDDFDVAVATPDQMGIVGKLGRILGPRGKMPNPKTGTVTMDVGKAVQEAKAGKLEYRTDRGANVHVAIGKKSFEERQLVENYAALVDEIMRAKPAAAKGRYIKTVTLTSTMGPGIHGADEGPPRGTGRSTGRRSHYRVARSPKTAGSPKEPGRGSPAEAEQEGIDRALRARLSAGS
jgi:large subunit ribosomal protein L1